MGWRTVIVDSTCKISYKNGYLVLKKEQDSAIHISEIDMLMVASTQVGFTCIALNELVKNKVKIIFCDEKHNPLCETVSFYGAHNVAKRLHNQIKWDVSIAGEVFREIARQKILNQGKLLLKWGHDESADMLFEYADTIEHNDRTNREGHSAKVYFNALFGMDFARTKNNAINDALDYGYTILLSYINREVVANGCLTQLGIKHCNEYNQFNLSCDIIEPFRQIVDDFVLTNVPPSPLNSEYKYALVGLLSQKVNFGGQSTYLSNAISISTKSVIDTMDSGDLRKLKLYEF